MILKYRRDIDGLRAIAVLSVLIYHYFPTSLISGYVGVDVFFVISGYLVSSIILRQHEEGSFSFLNFYSKRILRIYPAYIIIMVLSLIIGWFFLFPNEYMQLGKHVAGSSLFAQNFVLWLESGYFDSRADVKPLLHLWSLSIEEQFYIILPFSLLLFKKHGGLVKGTFIFATISYIASILYPLYSEAGSYYSPLGRFWELYVGVLLAQASVKEFIRKDLLSVIAAIGVIGSTFLIPKDMGFPGFIAIIPVLSTALAIKLGEKAWFNKKILSSPVLVEIGLISYPLYIYHWFLLAMGRIILGVEPSFSCKILLIFSSFCMAKFTQAYVEKNIRYTKKKFASTALLLGSFVVGLLGFYVFSSKGVPSIGDGKARIDYIDTWDRSSMVTPECRKIYPNYPESEFYCNINDFKESSMLVVGDSHALHLAEALAWADRPFILLGSYPPFYDVIAETPHQDFTRAELKMKEMNLMLDFAVQSSSIETVVLSMRGPYIVSGRGFGKLPLENDLDLKLSVFNRPHVSNDVSFKELLDSTLKKLVNSNKKVVIVLDNAELGFDIKECLSRPLIEPKRKDCRIKRENFESRQGDYRRLVKEVLKNYPGVVLVDAAEKFCDENYCYGKRKGVLYYRDDDHLSFLGAKEVVEGILKAIERY